jgi:hypothetical protein
MEEPAAEAVEPPVLGGDGEHDHYGDPDDEVHDQRRVRHRRHEREHEAGVSHHERPQHEARPRGHACEQPHREQHRADEPGPARRHEQPVPAPVLVAHDRVTGDVAAVVVLPVPARDVRAQLVRQRRDQRRHHQQRVRLVRREVRRAPVAASVLPLFAVLFVLLPAALLRYWEAVVLLVPGAVHLLAPCSAPKTQANTLTLTRIYIC